MKNHKFAKILPSGEIEFADSVLRGRFSVTISPSAEEYKQFGFLPVEDICPKATSEFYYTKDGYKQDGDKIKAVYKAVHINRTDNQNQPKPNFIQKALRKVAFKLIGTY